MLKIGYIILSESMIPHSQPWITQADILAVQSTLLTGMIARGNTVTEFEEKVADYLDLGNAIAVSSGTAAILLSLKTLGIDEKDEVILPTYVCHFVCEAIIETGAKPIFCDIGYNWNINYQTVSDVISACTKALICVHVFGIPADIFPLKSFNIPIIEDCCQSLGTTIDNTMSGSIGDICVCSFHATKCLTSGEGGMFLTKDTHLIEVAKKSQMISTVPAPLSDLQAALGLNQLLRYNEMLRIRQEIAHTYLSELPEPWLEQMMKFSKGNIYFRFPLTINTKKGFEFIKESFAKLGVHVRRGVDELLHRRYGCSDKKFPVACSLYEKTVSLPIYPSLSAAELEIILNACQEIYKKL